MQLNTTPDTTLPAGQLPQVPRSPEQSLEELSNGLVRQLEQVSANAAEQAPLSPQPAAASNVLPTSQPLTPTATQPVPSTATQPTDQPTDQPVMPAPAGHMIEKTWIDQADTIITQNANDPHKEEDAQEQLSAAYLKQRFGLEIKRSGASDGK